MSTGWVIFDIFIFLVCMGMVTLLIIALCTEYNDEMEDNDNSPKEDKDD